MHPYKRARKRLHTVVNEIERPAQVSQEELECPICMGELFRRISIPQPRTTRIIPKAETRSGTIKSEAEIPPPSTGIIPPAIQSPDHDGSPPPPDSSMVRWFADDVVSLRTCQHIFHGRCLTTWFMMERYDCPLCRAAYWGAALDEKIKKGEATSVGADDVGVQERWQHQIAAAASADVTVPLPTWQRERSFTEQSTSWAGVVV
ncbi:hypothetical protein VMCG_05563 [Cytospora schulzeri]|uniref:RING-type domain-containing protein n=1 Tax=Cytospora schulzeri TaxID=448051 RepID=A0A423WF12_9PEZI|nr:hypothetical protein VMCG_05563 [Valsa malicola]